MTHKLVQRNIRNAITISSHKLLITNQILNFLNPPPRIRIKPCISKLNIPSITVTHKILPNQLTLIAQSQNKVIKAIMRIKLHNMPKNRPAPNLNQRLRNLLSKLPQTGAPAAAKNDCLHNKGRQPEGFYIFSE